MAQRSILRETTVLPSVRTRTGFLDDQICEEVGVWEKKDDPQTQSISQPSVSHLVISLSRMV